MERLSRLTLAAAAALLIPGSASAQVIEFESGGLKYLTQTKNGVTVMFAQLPVQVREYAVIQVAVSNGSTNAWTVRPEDFAFLPSMAAAFRPPPPAVWWKISSTAAAGRTW
jgi:hypothetical protein